MSTLDSIISTAGAVSLSLSCPRSSCPRLLSLPAPVVVSRYCRELIAMVWATHVQRWIKPFSARARVTRLLARSIHRARIHRECNECSGINNTCTRSTPPAMKSHGRNVRTGEGGGGRPGEGRPFPILFRVSVKGWERAQRVGGCVGGDRAPLCVATCE